MLAGVSELYVVITYAGSSKISSDAIIIRMPESLGDCLQQVIGRLRESRTFETRWHPGICASPGKQVLIMRIVLSKIEKSNNVAGVIIIIGLIGDPYFNFVNHYPRTNIGKVGQGTIVGFPEIDRKITRLNSITHAHIVCRLLL